MTSPVCPRCRDTGRILDPRTGDVELYCDECDLGREAEGDDCTYCYGEGLCDTGSYHRVACECPAGQDLIEAHKVGLDHELGGDAHRARLGYMDWDQVMRWL